MTSTWITRAPASSTSPTCSPRRAKSADRIDGATRTSRRRSPVDTLRSLHNGYMDMQGKRGADAGSQACSAHVLADRRSHRSPIGRTKPRAAIHVHMGMSIESPQLLHL